MSAASPPHDEARRLARLASYEVLDTAAESAFDDLARLAARVSGMPFALLSLIDRSRQWIKACHGLDATEIPRERSLCAQAILTPDRALLVTDARQDPRFANNPLVMGAPGIRAYAGVPLVDAEGLAIGTLCVMDREARLPDQDRMASLGAVARSATITLEWRRAQRQMERLALSDALTGLMNRPAFLQALRQAVARQRRDRDPFSLLCFDLDGLKRVNDVHGHATGDRALVEVARLVLLHTRVGDVGARLGGDEFAVLLQGGDGAEAALVADRLRRVVKQAMDARGWPITISIGAVSFLTPPEDEDEALAMADELMSSAKRSGPNRALCVDHGVARGFVPALREQRQLA
jgi:diguanylate cyclase (GGDEF)-like protein